MKNKRKLIILSIVAILLIVVLSSASYAYFTTTGSTGTEETISSGTMALSFSDGPQINATNLAPGDYIEKTFSVTNTGTLATTYDVYLSEVVNTFVQKSDLVYEITSNDGGYNTPNQVVVPNQEAKIVDTQSIAVGATHHYTLKITYKLTNQIQNDNMGRGFTAKININEYNLNNTEKLLKLLDTSGNLVDKQMISSGVADYYYNLANTSLTGTTNIYCNNGGIPRIENNQLIVSGLTIDTECKMSSDVFDTINSKLATSKTGVVMTNNQNGSAPMTIQNNKEVVFDLNGKEINNQYASDRNVIINYGTLTINDSVGTGKIETNYRLMTNYGNLTVNNGSFIRINSSSTSGGIIGNSTNANVTINNGNFYTDNTWGIFNSGSNNSITINNGTFESTNGTTIQHASSSSSTSTITINNGTFRSNNINIGNSVGTITINNGEFYTTNYNIDARDDTLIINNGIFYSTKFNLIAKKGITTINDGYFETSSDGIGIQMYSTGILNINGGTILCTPKDGTEYSCKNIGNASTGTINITETDKPIYIGGLSIQESISGSKVVTNYSSGTINIKGTHDANACTADYNDTTTGICIYQKRGRSILNEDNATGTINIDKAYMVSSYFFTISNYSSGVINVKNSIIENITGSDGVSLNTNNNNEHPENAVINVCNSRITSNVYDLNNRSTGILNYSSNNIFTNGTNVPNNRPTSIGSITETSEACNWSID